jgi:hypothetical protein
VRVGIQIYADDVVLKGFRWNIDEPALGRAPD